MKTELVDPEALTAHPRNSRVHSQRQIDELARAIKEFGFTQPVVVTPEHTILIGHARVQAAIALGLQKIPVIVTDLSEADARGLVVADNALHEFGAGWDEDILNDELRTLMAGGFDVTLTGFDPPEPLVEPTEQDEDAAPPVPDVATCQAGDVWLMGPHRLVIGDSTDPAAVALALKGNKSELMVTDPPYGVDYDPEWRGEALGQHVTGRGKVLNDDQADWRKAWALFPGAAAYVWHASSHAPIVLASLRAAGFEVEAYIVWAKPRAVLSRGAYHWQHEVCLFGKRPKAKLGWAINGESDVWEISHSVSKTGHGTQKPVTAMRKPMLMHTKPGAVIYDPFMGSGTSIIAAQTCGRISVGIELNPAYGDVGVQRWQNFTGKHAYLEIDGEPGPSYTEISQGVDA